MKHKDDGFTGLEAAIVLIAFVVVAAVFSYVVLGAGFFTTQKAQQTVYSAVGQSTSTLEVVGNVYGLNSTPSDVSATSPAVVDYVNFTLGLAAGATPVDMSKTTMVYSDANSLIPLGAPTIWTKLPTALPSTSGGAAWAITGDQNSPTGTFTGALNPNEQYTITCYIPGGIPANDRFTIAVNPSVGAAFSIVKTVPGSVTAVNIME
jgi:flagellin FlaB